MHLLRTIIQDVISTRSAAVPIRCKRYYTKDFLVYMILVLGNGGGGTFHKWVRSEGISSGVIVK